MERALFMQGIPEDQFWDRMGEVIQLQVHEALRKIKAEELQEKMLKPSEVVKLFSPKITRQTLHNYANRGLLKKHFVGRSTFYKYSEVMEAMQSIKRFKS